jgi:hypothetical protein
MCLTMRHISAALALLAVVQISASAQELPDPAVFWTFPELTLLTSIPD